MKKAVVYARYSSERQTEQSIEGQLRVCKKFAKDNDYIILDEYIDRAMTGTNDNRFAFQQMIRDSARGDWQYVLVYKGDRFSRNRIESAIHKKTLRDNGVKLVSATENIPDTPEGIILESLLEGMAEYYSAELSQKVKRGRNESRLKRQFMGGPVPFGWDIVNKKPVINDNEAAVIQRVYAEYIDGKTARQITCALAAEGVVDKRGNPFKESAIYKMLRQVKYIGDDTYPAIISSELREKVDAIIEQNKRAPSRRKSNENFILSGKLVCGECGGLMTGESGTSKTGTIHYYYKCFEKKKHTRACTMPSVRKDEIENKVFEACCDVLNGGYIPHVVDMAYNLRQEELEANSAIQNLQAQLSDREKSLRNLMKAIEDGIYTETTKQRLIELEESIAALRYQIEVEKIKASSDITKEDYYDFLSNFMSKHIEDESFKEDLINFFVRKIVLFRDKICITFNYFPDKDRGKIREYDIDFSEYKEIEKEHSLMVESSNLFTKPQ